MNNDNVIVRRVCVDRTRTPQQMLDGLGLPQAVDPAVVSTMPRGTGSEVDVEFFVPDVSGYVSDSYYLTVEELRQAFERRNLREDPYAVIRANEEDPAFASGHPNWTVWMTEHGQCAMMVIGCSLQAMHSGPVVQCVKDENPRFRGFDQWFGGVRNQPSNT